MEIAVKNAFICDKVCDFDLELILGRVYEPCSSIKGQLS